MSSLVLAIYSGVVPQQPPRIVAPFWARDTIIFENSSEDRSNTVFPFSILGSPALGLTKIGTEERRLNSSIIPSILSGPNEQFIPSASTPRPSSIAIIAAGSAPVISLPLSSYTLVTKTGSVLFSFAASTAAFVSRASFIVSIIIKSTPHREAHFTFSA